MEKKDIQINSRLDIKDLRPCFFTERLLLRTLAKFLCIFKPIAHIHDKWITGNIDRNSNVIKQPRLFIASHTHEQMEQLFFIRYRFCSLRK